MVVRRAGYFGVVFALMALLVTGCGGGGEETATTSPDESASMEQQAAETAESESVGSLAVTAQFEGDAPEREEFDASGNPECGTDTIQGERVVVNENETLRNVVVAVTDGPSGLEADAGKNATIDQADCRYTPHVVTLGTEGTLTVKDSDEGLHNVRATTQDGQQLFNKTTFKGQSVDVEAAQFDGPGAYRLECNVHPWMEAYVYVTENGRAGVTNDEGQVELAELPAGEYTVKAWHEQYGAQTQTVTVEGDEATSLSFTFSAGS